MVQYKKKCISFNFVQQRNATNNLQKLYKNKLANFLKKSTFYTLPTINGNSSRSSYDENSL